MNGHVHHIPCVEGQSIVHTALQWECDMDRIGVPTDLSPQVKAECTGREGKLFGEDDLHWNPWHMVRGSWFGSVDLDQPEHCGYFPRQAVADYLSNPHDVTLDESDMIPVEEYRELPEEEKKAYQYYEYTGPYGNRAILRDFKRAVQARVDAWNSEIAFCKDHMQISLSDVRVLLVIG